MAIEISDNGAGISADLLPRVFDLFTQSERTLDRAQGGLGIGLWIVKQLIEMHGGECVARSAGIGQGSTLERRCLEVSPSPMPPRIPSSEAARDEANIESLTIMSMRRLHLPQILKLEGHQCQAVFSANEALGLVATLRPNFVLLDIGLPGLDG